MESENSDIQFETSLKQALPPSGWCQALKALWWEAKGDWESGHACLQCDSSREGDRVHAFLHRVEGDESNAGCWYERAGEAPFSGTVREERIFLVRRLLKNAESHPEL